jgi:hypothetical protein
VSKTLPRWLVQNGAPNVEHPTALTRARTHPLGKDHTTECGPNRQLRPVVRVTVVTWLIVGFIGVISILLLGSAFVALFTRDEKRRTHAVKIFNGVLKLASTVVGGLVVVAAKIHGALLVSNKDVAPAKRRSRSRTTRSGQRSSSAQRRPSATRRKAA